MHSNTVPRMSGGRWRAVVTMIVVAALLAALTVIVSARPAGAVSGPRAVLRMPFAAGGKTGIESPAGHAPTTNGWSWDLHAAPKYTSVGVRPRFVSTDGPVTLKLTSLENSGSYGWTVGLDVLVSGTLVGNVSFTHLATVYCRDTANPARCPIPTVDTVIGETATSKDFQPGIGFRYQTGYWQVTQVWGVHVHIHARKACWQQLGLDTPVQDASFPIAMLAAGYADGHRGQCDRAETFGVNGTLDAEALEGSVIRRADGVSWVIKGRMRHHIPTHEADLCARYRERRPVTRTNLSYDLANTIPEAKQAHGCSLENTLLRGMNKPDPKPSYAFWGGQTHWVSDRWTYDYLRNRGFEVVDVGLESEIKALPAGTAETPKLDPASIPVNSIIRRSDGVSWVIDANRVRHHIPFVQDDVCWRRLRGYPVVAVGLTVGQAGALSEADGWLCVIGDRVVKSDDGSSHFVDTTNTARLVPDVDTFSVLSRKHPVVGPWPATDVNLLPRGPRMPYQLDPVAVANSIVCRGDGVCWAVDGLAVRHHIPTYADNVCWRWVNGWKVTRNGVNAEQANSLSEQGPWGCSMNGRIVVTNEGAAYYMEGNTRRWIQDPYDFACYASRHPVIRGMGMAELQPLHEGHWMPLCVGAGQRLVSIRSTANGAFVSAELGYGGADYAMLRARSGGVGGWEQFRLVGDCSSSCVIQSVANRRLVSAELGYQGYAWGEMRARATGEGGWERFRLVGDCNTGCAILALGNGRYVSAELNYTGAGYAMLRARATSVQGWERFQIG